jgi:hypothetical protein
MGVFRASKWEWPTEQLERLLNGEVDLVEAITDPEQAMVVGRQCLYTAALPELELCAAAVFERAGQLGGNHYRWRASEEMIDAVDFGRHHPGFWQGAFDRGMAWWRHTVACEFPPEGGIECDPTVLAPIDGHGRVAGMGELVGVTPNTPDVVEALARAVDRFYLVNELGEECDPDELDADGVWTVPYVGPIEQAGGVARVRIDTQAVVRPLMAGVMLHVLREELTQASTPGIRVV